MATDNRREWAEKAATIDAARAVEDELKSILSTEMFGPFRYPQNLTVGQRQVLDEEYERRFAPVMLESEYEGE